MQYSSYMQTAKRKRITAIPQKKAMSKSDEGPMLSGGRDNTYDVIVVGGGPIGLSAAYQCAKKGKKVLVLERYTCANEYSSSPGFSRQFRTCYSQRNLCSLAVKAGLEWTALMDELCAPDLLQKTGTLWFGDQDVTVSDASSEGNITLAIPYLNEQKEKYDYTNRKEEIQRRWPFIAGALSNIKRPHALFVPNGGTVNVPAVVDSLARAIKAWPESDVLENRNVTRIDHSLKDIVRVHDASGAVYKCKKVILTPGTNVNNVLSTIHPEFPQIINCTIYLWTSVYFKFKQQPPYGEPFSWPTWYFFGKEKEPIDGARGAVKDKNCYYGFPIEGPTPNLARAAPAFVSNETSGEFVFDCYPPSNDQRHLDKDVLKFTHDFVKSSMSDLNSTQTDKKETCLVSFAVRDTDSDEEQQEEANSGGIVLDFLPDTDKRIVVNTGGYCMKYVPILGIILAELALTGSSDDYKDEIQPMNISRGVLVGKTLKATSASTAYTRARSVMYLF